jgi:antirestriction protein ArdC
LRIDGQPYQGINVLTLWGTAVDKGYTRPVWMTFKKAQELGGCVKKGEKGTLVVYANKFEKSEVNEKGEETTSTIPFLKGYTVFNVEQINGLPEEFYKTPTPAEDTKTRMESVEKFIADTKAIIQHGGNKAFYSPAHESIQMPPSKSFRDIESYYATLAHEITHWTNHPSRLDRQFGQKRFGNAAYAMEELVAEIGSAYLCAALGITPETREDHAAYIQSWLSVLKKDNRAIFTAASHAQRAVDYLQGLSVPGNKTMINLYDYTDEKKVFVKSFSTWVDAENGLEYFKKENPKKIGFICGEIEGKYRINNEGCPVNIFDL